MGGGNEPQVVTAGVKSSNQNAANAATK